MQPTPTHTYQSKDWNVLVEWSLQECEDAKTWHQFSGYTIQPIVKYTVHCNNCEQNFRDDSDLVSVPEEWYHCPTCHTDWYLVDIK